MWPRPAPSTRAAAARGAGGATRLAPPKEPSAPAPPSEPPPPLPISEYLCAPTKVDALMRPSDLPQQAQPVGAGLENLGNSCYFNSILQCLIHTLPLANFFLSGQHSTQCRVPRQQSTPCVACHMEKLVKDSLLSKRLAMSPSEFLRTCLKRAPGARRRGRGRTGRAAEINKTFALGRQEDSHELFRCLVDAVQRGVLWQYGCGPRPSDAGAARGGRDPKGIKPRVAETTALHQIFGGRLRSQVHCLACRHDSNTEDPFLDLSLELPASVRRLETALEHFTRVETLDVSNQYRCDRCRNHVQARKQFLVSDPPRILCIQLKRFEFAFMHGGKISRPVPFPDTLELAPYLTPEARNAAPTCPYRLYALNVHIGGSPNSGHYYSYVRPLRPLRDRPDAWVLIDDAVRQPAQRRELDRECAYILFYQRTAPAPSPAAGPSGPQKREREEVIGPQLPPQSRQRTAPAQPHTGPLPPPFATAPLPHFQRIPPPAAGTSAAAARVSQGSAPAAATAAPKSNLPKKPPAAAPASAARAERTAAAELAMRAAAGEADALAGWRELAAGADAGGLARAPLAAAREAFERAFDTRFGGAGVAAARDLEARARHRLAVALPAAAAQEVREKLAAAGWPRAVERLLREKLEGGPDADFLRAVAAGAGRAGPGGEAGALLEGLHAAAGREAVVREAVHDDLRQAVAAVFEAHTDAARELLAFAAEARRGGRAPPHATAGGAPGPPGEAPAERPSSPPAVESEPHSPAASFTPSESGSDSPAKRRTPSPPPRPPPLPGAVGPPPDEGAGPPRPAVARGGPVVGSSAPARPHLPR